MKHIISIAIILAFGMTLNAQEEKKVIIKKEKTVTIETENDGSSEKTVTVDVNGSDEQRTVKVKTIENGEEKVIKWKDNGEMPEEIKNQLKSQGIDLNIIESGQNAMFISDKGEVEHVKIIKKDIGDGEMDEDIEIEWDGEGPMPEDMKKLLDEHDIDLAALRKKGKGAKMRMRMLKEDGKHGRHKRMMRMQKGMGPDMAKVKVYMGAQIGPGEGGTGIIDVMVDSPAHKAGLKKGDVITQINGANTKNVDDMMMLLSLFDVNDTVEVKYLRGGKSRSTKVTLAPRPEPYR